MNVSKPIVLVILDGWGEWEITKGNPLAKAKLPTIEQLNKHYPKTLLQASGMSAGLPWGVRGNSEVGHQAIGSGQIIFQFLPAISSSIGDGSFFKNEVLINSFADIKKNDAGLHLVGLLSDGGVHSHIDHLFALLEMAKKEGLKNIFVHAISDGRDSHPQSVKKYLEILNKKLIEIGVGKIATLSGRYFTMDRNNNWDRIEKAFSAMSNANGIKEKEILKAVDNQYAKGTTDEYLEPIVFLDEENIPVGQVKEGDTVICFNFRKDRSRQITKAFALSEFKEFKDKQRPKISKFICFSEYEKDLPVEVVFHIKEIGARLGEVISKAGKKQLRISETEKYAHVTYFFNGGLEKPYPGEERVLIPSKNIISYADLPEMSLAEINEKLIENIDEKKHDFILVNFANADMVGHTGDVQAAIQAVEFIDSNLDKLINKVLDVGGELLITADHGNVEEMINIYSGEIDTQHSKNPVPCWYVSAGSYSAEDIAKNKKPEINGMLIDIAPTILELMDLEKPKDMMGMSLLEGLGGKK